MLRQCPRMLSADACAFAVRAQCALAAGRPGPLRRAGRKHTEALPALFFSRILLSRITLFFFSIPNFRTHYFKNRVLSYTHNITLFIPATISNNCISLAFLSSKIKMSLKFYQTCLLPSFRHFDFTVLRLVSLHPLHHRRRE